MISYQPLWETMKKKGATTYTLRNKGSDYNLSGSTILRLQAGESVSTNTLDTLCKILNCNLSDVAVFIPDGTGFFYNKKKTAASLLHKAAVS